MAEVGCIPYFRARTKQFTAESALKVLHAVDESRISTRLPSKPEDGDVYIYKSEDKNEIESWKNGTKEWRLLHSVNIPKRNPLVLKLMYAHVLPNGKDCSGLQRDVFIDVSDRAFTDFMALLHYRGSDDSGLSWEIASTSEVSKTPDKSTSDPDIDTAVADTVTGKVDHQVVSPAGSSTGGTTSDDIESALATLKTALQKKSGSKPVLDMVNKLVESVTSTEDNTELDYCLVVSDKKSGKSSVIGTPEIASPRRSARKRVLRQEDESDDEDDRSVNKSKMEESQNPTELGDYELLTAKGKLLKFPKPKKESCFSFSIISDEEMDINSDFFDGRRAKKNRERYLKIRNHMMVTWQKQKPQYLSICQARKGLKDCGDVTPMTRIHQYLECKGVINFKAVKGRPWLKKGKTNTPQSKRRKIKQEEEDDDDDDNDNDDDLDEEPMESDTEDISEAKDKRTEEASISKQSPKKRKVACSAEVETESKDYESETAVTNKTGGKRGRKSAAEAKKTATVGKTTSKADSVLDTPGTRSSRRTRNVATPNWADIISGRKSFKKDGGVFITIKTEPESETEDNPVNEEPDDGDTDFVNPSEPVEDDFEIESNKIDESSPKKAKKTKPSSVRKTNVKEAKNINTSQVRVDKPDGNEVENLKQKETNAQEGEENNLIEQDTMENNMDDINLDGTEKTVEKKTPSKAEQNAGDVDKSIQIQDAGTAVNFDADDDANLDTSTADSGSRSASRARNKFSCPECKKKFSIFAVLEDHLRNDHGQGVDGIDADDDDDEDVEGDDDDDYAAEIGLEPSGPKKIAKWKVRKSKKPAATGKPTCPICGQVFLTEANLKRHGLLHTNKMYECPFCAKILKRLDYLKTHIRKVHKEVNLVKNPIDFDKYTHELVEGEVEGETNTAATDESSNGTKLNTGLGKKVCPECNQLFNSNEEIEDHMLSEHGKELKDASYTCQGCKKQFKTLVSYQVHKLTHRKRKHICPSCGESFMNNSQLQVHRRNDHQLQFGTLYYFGYVFNDNKICCEICNTEFVNIDDYHKHRPEHLVYKHLCKSCGNGFNTEADLEKHTGSNCTYANLHLGCGVCSLKFSNYDTRRKHVQSSHKKSTQFYCHHCAKCFDSLEDLTDHFNFHKDERIFMCEVCDKRFFEKRNLIDHRDLHNTSKDWQCHICNRYYLSSKSLQRHIKLHLNKSTKNCKHCNLKFCSVDELSQHIASAHTEIDEDVELQCKVCSRTFLDNSRLLKHMQIHDGKNNYTCEVCGSMFDANYLPQWKHMKKAHPVEYQANSKKAYNCEICEFTTYYKQRLERHLETHNESKNFECQFCGRRYQTTSSLLTHMIVHRGKVRKGAKPQPVCTWPHCTKQFIKHSLYKRHLISHIFKIKMGKELCDCGKCQYSAPLAGQSYFVHDDLEYSHVGYVDEEGNPLVAAKMDAPPQTVDNGNKSVLNLQVLSNDGEKGYDTMEVLQEAIAQIEDIENKAPAETNDKEDQVVESLSGSENKMSTQVEAIGQTSVVSTNASGEIEVSTVEMTDGVTVTETTTADGYVNMNELHEADQVVTETSVVETTTQSGEQIYIQSEVQGEIIQDYGYECGVCELMFRHKCEVLIHLETEHIEHRFPECGICGKVIIDKKNLTEHMVIHEESKKFKCEVCSKTFRTKPCLKQHSYVHAEQKPFTCNFCGHGFTQKGFYLQHIRRHTGIKPFKCFVCQKAFVSKNLLRIHMYSHANSRPHKCELCPKSFTENYLLVAHMRTHNDDRPYQCGECEKSFFVKPKLLRHLNGVHGIPKMHLTNYVPTRVGEGIGYRDKTKLTGNIAQGLTNAQDGEPTVVYINSDGQIVGQEVKTSQPRMTLNRPIKIKPKSTYIGGEPQVMTADHLTGEEIQSFEVVTKRDEHGSVQVNPVIDGEISFTEGESVELDGQNYTLVTQDGGPGEGQITLITQTIDDTQGQGHIQTVEGEGQIQVITQEVADGELITGAEGDNMRVISQAELNQSVEDGEKFSINIGEDGSVDMADFDKIEALRNMYGDQQIVIVVESQQQEG